MVRISDDKLLRELQQCYKENGKVTATILNDPSNEYPTQPTYSSRFGSLGEALEKCGIESEKPGKSSKWTREEIINTVQDWYTEDKKLNTSVFNSSNTLPSTHIIYSEFNTLKELYDECEILKSVENNKRNLRQKISKKEYTKKDKSDLIHHLLWVQSQEGNVKVSTINKCNGPSTQVYKSVFGSISNARKEAGLKSSYRENYKDRIGELPENYDETADGYIYVLQMRRGAESYYYVGMSENIIPRLNSHSSGKSIVTFHHKLKRDTLSNLGLVPKSILRIENMYKKDEESDESFRDRMKSKEHVVSYEISSGLNTSNILGGVS